LKLKYIWKIEEKPLIYDVKRTLTVDSSFSTVKPCPRKTNKTAINGFRVKIPMIFIEKNI